MYKKVSTYAICTLIILAIILSLINYKFVLPGILGLIVGIANLFISGIVTNDALAKGKVNILIYFGFLIKIFATSIIGMILFTYNKYYLFVYMAGYISHFISLALYSISLKDK
jgi:ATP synthase protein I